MEVKSEDLAVCNPLGVVRNSAQKCRLIMDLCYVNQYLRSCKFKYDDIRTAADLFIKMIGFLNVIIGVAIITSKCFLSVANTSDFPYSTRGS